MSRQRPDCGFFRLPLGWGCQTWFHRPWQSQSQMRAPLAFEEFEMSIQRPPVPDTALVTAVVPSGTVPVPLNDVTPPPWTALPLRVAGCPPGLPVSASVPPLPAIEYTATGSTPDAT